MSGASLGDFVAGWELFRLPTLAAAIGGGLLGALGVYVVLRRMIFLSAAVSQAAGLGVAASFYLGLHLGVSGWLASPQLGAALFTLAAVALVAGDRRASGDTRDGALGLIWLVGASGTLIVGSRIVEELHDIESLLFGSAVAVLPEDFTLLAVVAAILLGLQLWWWRGFVAVSFDPDGARVRALPTRLLEIALFASLALAISTCTGILGALPAFAFSVLPAMAAVRLARNLSGALWLAGLLGALSGVGGYVVAYLWEWPVGAAQTAIAAAPVVLAAIVRWIVRLWRR